MFSFLKHKAIVPLLEQTGTDLIHEAMGGFSAAIKLLEKGATLVREEINGHESDISESAKQHDELVRTKTAVIAHLHTEKTRAEKAAENIKVLIGEGTAPATE
jgi:hypothetical protein